MIVRLWERRYPDGPVLVEALERSDAELARVAYLAARPAPLGRVEHRVFDVTTSRARRDDAEALLALSRRDVDPTDDRAGAVARARKAVVPVALPAPAERLKRGGPSEPAPACEIVDGMGVRCARPVWAPDASHCQEHIDALGDQREPATEV
jgi:hypothetical protein